MKHLLFLPSLEQFTVICRRFLLNLVLDAAIYRTSKNRRPKFNNDFGKFLLTGGVLRLLIKGSIYVLLWSVVPTGIGILFISLKVIIFFCRRNLVHVGTIEI